MRAASIEVEAQGWQKCGKQSVVEPTGEELALWKQCFAPVAERWMSRQCRQGSVPGDLRLPHSSYWSSRGVYQE